MWKGYFDGACDNNGSREMGIGAILYDHEKEVARISERRGRGTSNVAEYLALIALLELAEQHGATGLRIYGDSQLVIKQTQGKWRVKAMHLLPYRNEAQRRSRKVDAVFHWIPREQNTVADKLSKGK